MIAVRPADATPSRTYRRRRPLADVSWMRETETGALDIRSAAWR